MMGVLAFVVVALIGCGAFAAEKGTGESGTKGEDVKQETKEAAQTTKEYVKENWKAIKKEVSAKLEDYEKDLENFDKEAEQFNEEMRNEYRTATESAQEKWKVAKDKLEAWGDATGKASEEAWQKTKKEFWDAMAELEAAYQNTKDKFEEQKK
jgi:Skp family chaperone for outer membrane proteins